MIDKSDIPTCNGCDKKGYWGFCDTCRTPEYPEVEAFNRSVRKPSHNDTNYPEW